MKKIGCIVALLFLTNFNVKAQVQEQQDSIQQTIQLKEVVLSANTILGSKFQAKNRTGSAYYISPQEIKKFNYSDINRVLRSVPGVTIYEEDGFGLRPNISLRGTSPERSAKISLMEDGVLIAPAPYSAPAAYYFPSVARMQAVEILKGSSQVQYGPFTTGGAINMISTQIPKTFNADLTASYGSFNSGRLHATIGDNKANFGYMVEYLNFNSDGFKNLDGGGDTGFDKNEIVAKFRVHSNDNAKLAQYLEVKFQYADEVSDETYLGLADIDFEKTPFRRYSASQNDQMTADHIQVMATHSINFSDYFSIATTAYYNGFSRNWYKLDKVGLNGNQLGIATVLSDPDRYSEYYNILTGNLNSAENAILVKANNRRYISKGIQTKLDYHWNGKNTYHDIEVGIRYHYDEEDRFQWVDGYNSINGKLNLTSAGTPGTDANRISDALAFSTYALYKLKYKDLTLTPGIRFESIALGRTDYGTNDTQRLGTNLSERENKVNIFIPGIGFNQNFNQVSIFGGVHKGFSPPTSQADEKPEESINYELGSRFEFNGFSGEVVGFYNDYSNLLGSDLAATGGTGSLDQFNAGEVNVKGIEVLLNYTFLKNNPKLRLPLTFAYTLTDTEFLNDFGSNEELWGEVNIGDELPYIAKHQFNTMLSLEHAKYELNLSGRFNGEFRTKAGTGEIPINERVGSNFILDFSAKYRFNKHVGLTTNIINLFNETYEVSRVPSGLRPGHPFGVYAGIALNL